MFKSRILLLTLAALATACDRRPNEAETRAVVGRALKGTLAFPNSTLIGMSAGTNAGELRFTTQTPAAEVAQWFRAALPLNKWQLEHDAQNRDGSIVIYATQGQRPLWIILTPNTGGPGATYTMVGAVVVEGDSIR